MNVPAKRADECVTRLALALGRMMVAERFVPMDVQRSCVAIANETDGRGDFVGRPDSGGKVRSEHRLIRTVQIGRENDGSQRFPEQTSRPDHIPHVPRTALVGAMRGT
jgi:hypothetical protein